VNELICVGHVHHCHSFICYRYAWLGYAAKTMGIAWFKMVCLCTSCIHYV